MNLKEKNYIRKIHIDGLFYEKGARSITFDEGVNCIFGANGSGKTTIINLLVAALACDIKRIFDIKFNSITIYTANSSKKRASRFFSVTRVSEFEVKYNFSNNDFSFNFSSDGLMLVNFAPVKKIIDEKLAINYLPLNRINGSDLHENVREREMMLHKLIRAREQDNEEFELFFDPIRRMLINLERRFKEDFSQRQRAIRTDLENLKETVLEKLLIDDDLYRKVSATNLHKIKVSKEDYKASVKNLNEIGLLLPTDKLEKHFTLIAKITDEVAEKQNIYFQYMSMADVDKNKDVLEKLTREYSAALRAYRSLTPFHGRLMSIFNDVEKSTDFRKSQLKLYKTFEEFINSFFVNKSFKFTEIGAFEFSCKGSPIKLDHLSSGEKHILALLGKVALSPSESSIFIADEPELSLHLSWQRKLLPAIEALSPRMQIIVATHAPAIIPRNANKIDLDEVIDGDTTI